MHVLCQIRVGFLPGVQWVTRGGVAAGCVGQGRRRPAGVSGSGSGGAGDGSASMPPTVPQVARPPHQTVGGWFYRRTETPRCTVCLLLC
ncbi:hypothetical protein C7T79_15425 [Xanthomonas oryzae pv. oryzicola]|nr:hypothetical protein C7T79_15425 [Xanthomonas oryzae pv. oryzicola]